ncbi:hypothetical protein CASFOL_020730 [Castilleja foliolosa]|uniref:Cytochrome P450 n=1 Tax=Castilleja foliolosa TaxID=1961234 RepID=A0ABD3D2F7_9LAMI
MAELKLIILCLAITTLFLQTLIKFLHRVWWAPVRLQSKMGSQGVKGPAYKFPHGNTKQISYMRTRSMEKPLTDISHDIFPRIQPHVYAWTKAYGENFLNWHGSECQLFVTEPEMIKEILLNKEGVFPKMDAEGYAKKLLGEALITNEGEKWSKIRKLADHTFHAESLKNMVPEMSSSVEMMLEKWKYYEGKEIDVFKEFGMLTTEVISRTAFGSSYLEGKHVFEMVAKLTAITVRNVYKVHIPGISMLLKKSDDEVEAEQLERRIKSSVLEIVKKRENEETNKNFKSDYLGQLVKISHAQNVKKRITIDQMIDEIKIIYGAGHLTTTSLLGWCVLLLAINQEWQEKGRDEVNKAFGKNNPHSHGIARLKMMTMIINECLRLYPPALTLTRKVAKEVKLGQLLLPPKMNIFIPILAVHHNRQIWGDDAHIFKPDRFDRGVSKATNNKGVAFLPFGLGPRTCVGSDFTTNEAKIVLSMILKKYKFALSTNYVHDPVDAFVLKPRNGVQVIIEPV